MRQRCAELWGTYKVMAQVMWKTWAGQRAAELTPQLVVRPFSGSPMPLQPAPCPARCGQSLRISRSSPGLCCDSAFAGRQPLALRWQPQSAFRVDTNQAQT